MRASGGVTEHLYEACLYIVRDDVLPAVRLGVDLVPREPDDVGEEPLGQAVLADHAGGQFLARGSQRDRTPSHLDIARFARRWTTSDTVGLSARPVRPSGLV